MATTWYAQNSSVNIDSVNEWNDVADGSGNWLTWPPAADDTLRANGKIAIAINVDFTCAQIDTITSGGGFTVSTARTITANVVSETANCLTSSATSGTTVTINGNVSGGTYPNYGVVNSSSGTVTVNGSVNAGTSLGINNASTGIINAISANGGNRLGAYGIYNASTGIVNIVNATGGTYATAYGVISNTGAVNVSGNVTAGIATGCNGIYCAGVGVITVAGNLIDNSYASAVMARVLIINQSTTNYHRVYTGATTRDMYYDLPDAGNVTEDDTVAGVAGTYHEATEAEVQSGVTFGASSELTGTYEGGGGASLGPFESGAFR
jgi:hypothetical protein